ncbi:MAG: molybdate ABC transporter substrate-binding protein [Acidimicrobiia bacterium]
MSTSGTGSSAVHASTFAVSATRPSGEITVFAASSLTDAFTEIGYVFEREHPGTTITFSFGASSTLASQIDAGAPADVFASADEADVDRVEESLRGRAVVFARNRLAIVVEPGNPRSIRTLADTVSKDVLLVLCAAEVPCGELARDAYRRAGVRVPDVASAENVRAALTTVALGEADAAVVYTTDLRSARGDVDGVRIPERDNVLARYPIAALENGENPRLARAFVAFVASDTAQRVLRAHGFLAP